MNILNRREILLTWSISDLSRVRDCLVTNGIKYIVNTRSSYRGAPGIRYDYAYEYRVYVHKNDYEQAKHIIGK